MKLNELREVFDVTEPEALTKYRGVYTYRRGFFYRHGVDSSDVVKYVMERCNKAGHGYRIIDHGEQWKAFRGGDSLKQGSHWWVKFEIL